MLLLISLLLLSLLIGSTLFFHPLWLVRLLNRWHPEILWFVQPGASATSPSSSRPRIFLTIDDSPNGARTCTILALLKQYQAKATFFCIGTHMKQFPEETIDILASGHSIGNHTMLDRASYQLSAEELSRDVAETQSVIDAAHREWLRRSKPSVGPQLPLQTVSPRQFFRPGHGFFNASMLRMARERGMLVELGSLYPFDPHIRIPWLIILFIKLRIWCNFRRTNGQEELFSSCTTTSQDRRC